jgi:hypothetical protein
MTDPSPEAFAAVTGLIALITEAKACGKRLADLQAQMGAVTASQAKLDAARAEHDRKVAADTAELAEREAELRQREVAAMIKENELAERDRRYAAELPPRYPFDPNLGPGSQSWSGLSREAE